MKFSFKLEDIKTTQQYILDEGEIKEIILETETNCEIITK